MLNMNIRANPPAAEWTIDGLRRLLRRTLGLRHDWNREVNVDSTADLTAMRLITATDAARRIGLGLIAIFPDVTDSTETITVLGEPTFAVMRGGEHLGDLLPLSDAADEWIDAIPADTPDGGVLVDGDSVIDLLTRAGWATDGPVTVPSLDLPGEMRHIAHVTDLRTVDGRPASPRHVASGAHTILLLQRPAGE